MWLVFWHYSVRETNLEIAHFFLKIISILFLYSTLDAILPENNLKNIFKVYFQ